MQSGEDLKKFLENSENMAVAELKWALFNSALSSFKRDFLLRPFPPQFKNGDIKNFTELNKVANNMPCLKSLNFSKLTSTDVDLLRWVLDTKSYSAKLVSRDKFKELKILSKQRMKTIEPDLIYEIQYSTPGPTNQDGDEKHFLYAYHGSQLSNFHSILHNGLRSNLNKTAAFGEGTYLSSELNVSLNWSPLSSPGSIKSSLGSRLGCVAFCEIIDDPTGVKYQQDDDNRSIGSNNSVMAGATSHSVPEKYLLVQNDSLVRIKYLLVFVEKSSNDYFNVGNGARQFLWKYRFWLMMLTYFVVLLAVGLANSTDFKWYIRRWSTIGEQDFQAYDET